MARINKIPKFKFTSGCGIGSGIHMDRASSRDSVGAIINKEADVLMGRSGSLIKSFIASANGCRIPYGPTILGPLRSCIYPKNFRSTSVRNAIAIRMGRRSVIMLIKYTIRERS